MEIVIVICLLIVIFLLVEEKITVLRKVAKKNEKKNPAGYLPDIMGRPKPVRSHALPNITSTSHNDEGKVEADNFDNEFKKVKHDIQIPEQELDEVFAGGPDLAEEEEEWNSYGISGGDSGFTTGVTFDELSTVGMLLQQEVLEPSQQNIAVSFVQKIQGTELFSLLENSMEGASQKIADLLDRSLSGKADSSSTATGNHNLTDFDIGEFV